VVTEVVIMVVVDLNIVVVDLIMVDVDLIMVVVDLIKVVVDLIMVVVVSIVLNQITMARILDMQPELFSHRFRKRGMNISSLIVTTVKRLVIEPPSVRRIFVAIVDGLMQIISRQIVLFGWLAALQFIRLPRELV
jgi:hypothetical protein